MTWLSIAESFQNGSNDLVSTAQLLLLIGWKNYTFYTWYRDKSLYLYSTAISYITPIDASLS